MFWVLTATLSERGETMLDGAVEAVSEGGGAPQDAQVVTGFYLALVTMMCITLCLAWHARPRLGTSEVIPINFGIHKWRYLGIWALAIGADWLQGPYVYHLYAVYGYDERAVAELFVGGFGASMLFGVFAGVAADVWGRRFCAQLYCVLYIFSCMTKHVNAFGVLMVGRIMGGIATSLLFTTFECWMVSEHKQRHGFSEALLRYMFGLMFFVSYFTAIVCGLCSQFFVNLIPMASVYVRADQLLYYGGDLMAFDLSAALLVCAMLSVSCLWDENYGETSDQSCSAFWQSFAGAATTLVSSWRVALLGCVVSAFEGSMYAFVFMWTPAIESAGVIPPHGHVFSALMMACMCGSSVFNLMHPAIAPSKVLLFACLLAVVALALATSCIGRGLHMVWGIFLGFLLFEFCVGLYFPAVGTLKSDIVPEGVRAGVYNIYRVPLNAVTCCVLLFYTPLRVSLSILCGILGAASLFTVLILGSHSRRPPPQSRKGLTGLDQNHRLQEGYGAAAPPRSGAPGVP